MMKTPEELYALAQAFITQHQNAHLSHDQDFLIRRCVAHLVERERVSIETAKEIVLQVIGACERRQRLVFIDE